MPSTVSVLAVLLLAATATSAEPQHDGGGETGKDGPVGAAPNLGSPPMPSLPVPHPAPDRPEKQPKPQESAPAGGSKPEGGQPPQESKPEGGPPPEESKPEGGPPAEESKPEGAPPAEESKPGSGAPPNLKPIAPEEAVGILGKKVYGPAGEDMGMVVDVLVDGEGRPRAAVIDFGGFLGVGSRKIATDWQLLQFRPGDRTQPVRLALGRAEVQAAPEYKPSSQSAEVVAPSPPMPETVAPDAEK